MQIETNLATFFCFLGGFGANVTVKGVDFECSGGSDLHPNPRLARESAASQLLAKLRSMAVQSQ